MCEEMPENPRARYNILQPQFLFALKNLPHIGRAPLIVVSLLAGREQLPHPV